jgi:hypothetical protein
MDLRIWAPIGELDVSGLVVSLWLRNKQANRNLIFSRLPAYRKRLAHETR